jgi:hypothetical protein
MAGTEQTEWHQTPGNHLFDVFDTIPLIITTSPFSSIKVQHHQPPMLQTDNIST